MESEMVTNQQMTERIRAAEESQCSQRLRLDEREDTINTLTLQNTQLTELRENMAVESQELSATTQRLNAINVELNVENERLQRQRNDALSSEDTHRAVLSENERLHARIKELEALLGIERQQNVALSTNIKTLKSEHEAALRERDTEHARELEVAEDVSRELGFIVETQRTELEAVQKAMSAMQKAHLSEVRSLRAQLSSLGEWNSALESERETASALESEKEKERVRQRVSLSAVAAERDIVAAQLAELSAQFNQNLSNNSRVKPVMEEKEKVMSVESVE